MDSWILNLEKREEKGTNAAKKVRQEEMIPAVMYSANEEAQSVQVSEREFNRVFKEAGTSSMITLKIGGEEKPAIIKDVQRHPYKTQVLHIDFQTLKMDETVKMTVPIILHGRDSIRLQPSILIQVLDQIDIECYPKDIPNRGGEVNVEDMTFDTPIMIKDLDLYKEGKITIFKDPEEVVATLNPPHAQSEDEGLEDEQREVEVIGAKKDNDEE